MMSNERGIKIMQDEGYARPIESENKLQKTEFTWWSSPIFIIFLTVSMSVLDAMVLYDIMDLATTQSENLGKIICFGIALILNMLPLLVAKFVHQAMYKIKRGAAVWALLSTIAFFTLVAATVFLRFSYQDQYGDRSASHIKNEAQVETTEEADTDTDAGSDTKGLAVVLLLSVEPLVTSIVNFGLAYISDDEVRALLNHLRKRRLELAECENDLNAYLATREPAEERCKKLALMDDNAKKAAQDRVPARCEILKSRAHLYLAEYLGDSKGASYVTAYEPEPEKISEESRSTLPPLPMDVASTEEVSPLPMDVEWDCEMAEDNATTMEDTDVSGQVA